MTDWRIPLSDIDLGSEELFSVQEVLKSRWLTMGRVTQDFESAFASYTGAKHALAVTNATAALHMACLAVGLKPGDEVIVPSLPLSPLPILFVTQVQSLYSRILPVNPTSIFLPMR